MRIDPNSLSNRDILKALTKGESKYHNRRTVIDGINFHSRKEGARYEELKLLVKAGAINDLELQPRYPLVVNGVKIATYVGDFRYTEDGEQIIEDTKGFETREYKLKKKLMLALYGITINET